MNRCANCFKEYSEEFDVCPFCGHCDEEQNIEAFQLYPGTRLVDRYIIGIAVGVGGFGIVYKVWDEKLETIVAIKECYPSGLVNRIPGTSEVILVSGKYRKEFDHRKERLLLEAKNIAKFQSHKNIVNVFEYFEANNTVYMVMEYLNGIALNQYLQQQPDGKLDVETGIYITSSICEALKALHKGGIIHRDISPDNIYIGANNNITLYDFGAAEFVEDKEDVDIILKTGFAPPEQYERVNRQGPWTDIYALGATMYLEITGIKPDESTNRKINDELVPPHEIDTEISENLSNAIMKAMAIETHLRFADVVGFQKALQGEKKVISLPREKFRRKLKRGIGIIAAVLILIIGLTTFLHFWNEDNLVPATILVWVNGDKTSSEYAAIESIAEKFKETYSAITIEIVETAKDEYQQKVSKAILNDELPNLFCSTGISESDLSNAVDISSVLSSKDAKNCYFLNDYSEYYNGRKKVPLGVDVPVVYILSSGKNSIVYDKATLTEPMDLGIDIYSVNANCQNMLSLTLNETLSTEFSDDIFFNTETSALFSSTKDYFKVQTRFAGRYKVLAITADTVYCQYDNEWSIGSGSKDEVKAATIFLRYMLSTAAQDIIYLNQGEKSGILPVNKATFDMYTEKIFGELSAINQVKDRYKFAGGK